MTSEPPAKAYPVTPDQIANIRKDGKGQLVVDLRDVADPIEGVQVRRCFPWSLPDAFVSLLDSDGKEIMLLRSLDAIKHEYRAILEDELHDKIFNPRITRIAEHKRDLGVIALVAETDRGKVTFQIRTRDDIRLLNQTHLLLRDADDNTYEITDVEALDPVSRRYLHEYI